MQRARDADETICFIMRVSPSGSGDDAMPTRKVGATEVPPSLVSGSAKINARKPVLTRRIVSPGSAYVSTVVHGGRVTVDADP
jgi:hypothetical protein